MKKEVAIKTPQENIVLVLNGKKVLFLENDNGLYHGLDNLEDILKQNSIEYTCLYEVSTLPMEQITKAIAEHDAIVFQTQWVYEVSKKLLQYMTALKEKKIVIECYVGTDPTWFYKPDVVHDVYVLSASDLDWTWRFVKLHKTKPYWDFKNKFDK